MRLLRAISSVAMQLYSSWAPLGACGKDLLHRLPGATPAAHTTARSRTRAAAARAGAQPSSFVPSLWLGRTASAPVCGAAKLGAASTTTPPAQQGEPQQQQEPPPAPPRRPRASRAGAAAPPAPPPGAAATAALLSSVTEKQAQVRAWAAAYYNGRPEVSDDVYDQICLQLADLEAALRREARGNTEAEAALKASPLRVVVGSRAAGLMLKREGAAGGRGAGALGGGGRLFRPRQVARPRPPLTVPSNIIQSLRGAASGGPSAPAPARAHARARRPSPPRHTRRARPSSSRPARAR